MGEMREIGNINERVVFSFSLTCRKYIFSQKLGSSSDLKPITAKVALTKFYSVFKGAHWTTERRERRDQKKQPHQVMSFGKLHYGIMIILWTVRSYTGSRDPFQPSSDYYSVMRTKLYDNM